MEEKIIINDADIANLDIEDLVQAKIETDEILRELELLKEECNTEE